MQTHISEDKNVLILILVVLVFLSSLICYALGISHGKKEAIRAQMEYKALHGCEDKMWMEDGEPVWNFKPKVLRPEPEFWHMYSLKSLWGADKNNYTEEELYGGRNQFNEDPN